ncbi:cytochrome P450 [Hysterangium stoloniferum]|nr:cytochrome P450 [Hysterangium stoloniferum]
MPSSNAVGICTTIGVLILTLRLLFRTRVPKGLKLPPGPHGDFLIGNLRDVPTKNEWETYSKWYKKHGDLVYLNVLGTSMLYVHSAEMAYELFERRSTIYSDRPMMPMLDLVGWSWAFTLMPYGERWRQHRHAFHRRMSSTEVTQYIPVQVKHAQSFEPDRNLLQRLHKSPSASDWELHIRHSIGASIMEITYGIDILPENDPYIATAEFAMKLGGTVGAPGSYLVNMIPLLRHLPEWFPGAGFKKKARIWRKTVTDMPTTPFQFVKKELLAGTAKPSLAATLLEEAYENAGDQEISKDEEELLTNVAGAVYGGGSDTLTSTLQIFIFAMILYPKAQLTAQRELDAVIGPNRLPSFEDRSSLPYVTALCKEVLRWHPVLATSMPHRLMQDDVVGQYFIPAGTMVLGNSWGILHSEAMFGPDTMAFKPERFLDAPDMKDPGVAFGFGRRACPGRAVAENGLFITIVSTLHVFNIVLPLGETSPDINAFTPGIFSRPLPFKCSFVPRSVAAEAMINQL